MTMTTWSNSEFIALSDRASRGEGLRGWRLALASVVLCVGIAGLSVANLVQHRTIASLQERVARQASAIDWQNAKIAQLQTQSRVAAASP